MTKRISVRKATEPYPSKKGIGIDPMPSFKRLNCRFPLQKLVKENRVDSEGRLMVGVVFQ
jgi:hypothetical protein